MAIVNITLHYITVNVIVLIHAISLLKVVKENYSDIIYMNLQR